MKRLVIAGVATALFYCAATVPGKASSLQIETPATSWAGFYLGGTLGMGLNTSEFVDPHALISPIGAATDNNGTSFNVGATAGYNWQIRSVVLGIEGDWSWTNFNKTSVGYVDTTIQSQWNWFSTIRARAGLAMDNFLIYATGGPAFVKVKDAAQYLPSAGAFQCGDPGGFWSCSTETVTGLAVGAGLEAMVTQHWSVKLEYLYLDMPTITTADAVTAGAQYHWNESSQVVRFGANYHF
jgi:outer membrane immunogenic protein